MWRNEQTLMVSTHFLFLLQHMCTDANMETRDARVVCRSLTQRQQENRLSGAEERGRSGSCLCLMETRLFLQNAAEDVVRPASGRGAAQTRSFRDDVTGSS